MKNIFSLIFSIQLLLFSLVTTAQTVDKTEGDDTKIHWVSIQEALDFQKNEPKKIFIDFYTNWCGPCKILEKNTFTNQDVIEYINKNYYAVKFNAEGNDIVNFEGKEFVNTNYRETNGRGYPHPFSQYMRVNSYPTMLFLDEQGKYIFPIKGYMDHQKLEPFLKVVATDDYKKIQTSEQWANWQNEFIGEFKANISE